MRTLGSITVDAHLMDIVFVISTKPSKSCPIICFLKKSGLLGQGAPCSTKLRVSLLQDLFCKGPAAEISALLPRKGQCWTLCSFWLTLMTCRSSSNQPTKYTEANEPFSLPTTSTFFRRISTHQCSGCHLGFSRSTFLGIVADRHTFCRVCLESSTSEISLGIVVTKPRKIKEHRQGMFLPKEHAWGYQAIFRSSIYHCSCSTLCYLCPFTIGV